MRCQRRLRGKVMIELMPVDIMSDAASFVFARSFARARGYRLLLRNATPALLRVLALETLEVDHVQFRWSPALAAAEAETVGALTPEGRAVLFRADTRAALDWGGRAAIRLFQDRPRMPRVLAYGAARPNPCAWTP